jgi:hypothetical protein
MGALNSFFNDDYSQTSKPKVKTWVDKVVGTVDNGKFFREPAVLIYRVIGVLSFLLTLAVPFYLADKSGMLGMIIREASVNLVVLVLAALAMGFFSMMVWINRSNKLRTRIATGNDIVVIPLIADMVQTNGECTGFSIMVMSSVFGIFFGFIGQLFLDPSHYFSVLLYSLGATVVLVLIGYGIVCLGHFFGENLRALAVITNNVRDLGDIHRAKAKQEEQA